MADELTELQSKIRRLHDALHIATEFPEIEPVSTYTENSYSHVWDYREAKASPERLVNIAQQVVASVASLKDYSKTWCRVHGSSFDVENWLTNTRPAAIVHDLWNLDKHGPEQNPRFQPRSGLNLKIVDLAVALRKRRGVTEMVIEFEPGTGKMRTTGFEIGITGRIVDDKGNTVGDFLHICQDAAEAWTVALESAGVPIK